MMGQSIFTLFCICYLVRRRNAKNPFDHIFHSTFCGIWGLGSRYISNLIMYLVIWDKIKNISFWKCADSILEVQKVVLHQEWKIHKNAFSIPSKSVILTRPFLAFPCCGQVSLLHFTMQGITKFVSKIMMYFYSMKWCHD